MQQKSEQQQINLQQTQHVVQKPTQHLLMQQTPSNSLVTGQVLQQQTQQKVFQHNAQSINQRVNYIGVSQSHVSNFF